MSPKDLLKQFNDKFRRIGIILSGVNRDGNNFKIDGPLVLANLTTAQRDALTAVNGMVIYNTTILAVQARVGGVWVSL